MSEKAVDGPFGRDDEGPREIRAPFSKFDDHIGVHGSFEKDFKPVSLSRITEVEEEADEPVDPKDSSALVSADSSTSQTVTEDESSASQDKTVFAEKDSTPPKEDEKSSTPIF